MHPGPGRNVCNYRNSDSRSKYGCVTSVGAPLVHALAKELVPRTPGLMIPGIPYMVSRPNLNSFYTALRELYVSVHHTSSSRGHMGQGPHDLESEQHSAQLAPRLRGHGTPSAGLVANGENCRLSCPVIQSWIQSDRLHERIYCSVELPSLPQPLAQCKVGARILWRGCDRLP